MTTKSSGNIFNIHILLSKSFSLIYIYKEKDDDNPTIGADMTSINIFIASIFLSGYDLTE